MYVKCTKVIKVSDGNVDYARGEALRFAYLVFQHYDLYKIFGMSISGAMTEVTTFIDDNIPQLIKAVAPEIETGQWANMTLYGKVNAPWIQFAFDTKKKGKVYFSISLQGLPDSAHPHLPLKTPSQINDALALMARSNDSDEVPYGSSTEGILQKTLGNEISLKVKKFNEPAEAVDAFRKSGVQFASPVFPENLIKLWAIASEPGVKVDSRIAVDYTSSLNGNVLIAPIHIKLERDKHKTLVTFRIARRIQFGKWDGLFSIKTSGDDKEEE